MAVADIKTIFKELVVANRSTGDTQVAFIAAAEFPLANYDEPTVRVVYNELTKPGGIKLGVLVSARAKA